MQLQWVKCDGLNWCSLLNVNLDHEHFNDMEGVYVIWHGGYAPRYVRVGQGVIKDRLAEHRENEEILAYRDLGLFVTWAKVAANDRDRVEKYLSDKLKPLIGERFPEVEPLEVNLPG
jgi:hypothetical protein